MAKENLTKSANIEVKAREIDFVTRFEKTWEHLREILGIMRPIKKQPGAVLKSKYAEGTLEDGHVGEGENIPYSKFTVKERSYEEMTIDKYAKGVSIEAIKNHGYENAVQMTDNEFLFQLQTKVTDRFYTYLKTGTLTSNEETFQMALAMAKGRVEDKFKQMHRVATGVVGFVNILDVYQYIGAANITIQNQFGFQYLKDFLGFKTIFLLAGTEIPRGMVIATPVENIVLYYIDPNESDFAKAGLEYRVSGETNLIGFHTEGNYHNAVSESFAIMGLTLFAEYIDAIAVIRLGNGANTLDTISISSELGTDSGKTVIEVSPAASNGNSYKYKIADEAVNVTFGQNVKTWTAWNGTDEITAANGKVITIIECDSNYNAVKAGSATIVSENGLNS